MTEKYVITLYVNVDPNADTNLKQAAYAAADRIEQYDSAIGVTDVTVDEVQDDYTCPVCDADPFDPSCSCPPPHNE